MTKIDIFDCLGVVHKLRWQDFGFFWSPNVCYNKTETHLLLYAPLHWHFLWYERFKKWNFLDHLPTTSCKRNGLYAQNKTFQNPFHNCLEYLASITLDIGLILAGVICLVWDKSSLSMEKKITTNGQIQNVIKSKVVMEVLCLLI